MRATKSGLGALFKETDRNTAAQSFAEELVVRRELADNFCFYNAHYDDITGAANWAQETLNVHRSDKRAAVYTREQVRFDAWGPRGICAHERASCSHSPHRVL